MHIYINEFACESSAKDDDVAGVFEWDLRTSQLYPSVVLPIY